MSDNKKVVLDTLNGVIEAIDVTMAEAQFLPEFATVNELYRIAFMDGMNCVREMVMGGIAGVEAL